MYAWWNSNKRHNYWRIYGGELDIRKYFGRRAQTKPLTGHHLGIYGQAFTYDFETGHKGYIGGKPGGTLWDKLNYAIGVEYGYSLPISRRLNLDFTLGVGYWGRVPRIYSLRRPLRMAIDQATSLVRAHEGGGVVDLADRSRELQ